MKKIFNKINFYLIVLFLSLAGSAFAQSDFTVSTNTTLDAGEYTYKNVLITNNAVLTLNSNTSLAGFKGVKIKELIKKYMRHQEIFDAKGYDDELDKGEKDTDENKDDGKF